MRIFNKDTFLADNQYDIFEEKCVLEFAELNLNDLGHMKNSEFNSFIKPYQKWNGIYIYKVNGKVLYVGKGSTIKSRLLSHQREIKLNHKNCPIFWLFYFNTFLHSGSIDIFLIKVDDEEGRVVLESCYQHKYESHFDLIKKEFDTKLRSNGISRVSPRIAIESLNDHAVSDYYRVFLEVLQCENFN